MFAKSGRLSALPQVLLLLALLLTMLPAGIAFGEGGTEASATEPSTEAAGDTATSDEARVDDAAADAEGSAEVVEEADPAPAPKQDAPADTGDAEASATTSGGAGIPGPYDPNVDGSPSGNGNGGGGDSKPCAGCVGGADDKNPPGQMPGPDDDGDNGYECDGNTGGGKTNPAHSGCRDPEPSIHLEKDGPATSRIGDTITYTFKVTNTGNTDLTNVYVTDPLTGTGQIAVTPSSLPAGDSGIVVVASGSKDYTVRAADVVNNNVHNVATAHGTSPTGEVTDTDPHDVAIPPVVENPNPSIEVVKDGPATAIIGETITYTFNVTNTGDTALTDVHITDPLIGSGQIAVTPSTLAVGATGTASATYTVRAQDVVNDRVPNTATVHGTPPTGSPVTDTDGHTVEILPKHTICHATGSANNPYEPITISVKAIFDRHLGPQHHDGRDIIPPFTYQNKTHDQNWPEGKAIFENGCVVPTPAPAIDLVKDGPDFASIGQTITYTFEVTNTGDTTLTNVHITDPLLGTERIAVTPSTLAPGQSGTANADYTVAEANIVDQNVHNEATATGTPPSGPDVTDVDPHDVAVLPNQLPPAIELIKDGPASAVVGDTITYTFRVENTGGQTLTNVHITDPLLGTGRIAVTPGTLAPGATGTATADYTVQQIHVIDENVHNVATVSGRPPDGPPVTDTDPHDVVVVAEVDEAPAINLEKSGPVDTREGEVITYTFKVTNTGTTSLANVHITDPMLTSTQIAVTPSTLPVNGVGTATATYTVTAADADAGEIVNLATAHGTSPMGRNVEDDDDHLVTIPGDTDAPKPRINLVKSGPATANVGDTITYRFRATNTGATVLTNVTITDPMLGGELTVTPSTLQVGESGTAKATYTVTEADGRRGEIYNTAIVTGDPPNGPPIEDEDDHTTDVPDDPKDPDDPDLPATGADVPTTLLISSMALLLGFALLRMTKSVAPGGPETWSIASPRLAGTQSAPPVHRRTRGDGWSTPRLR